MAINTKYVAAAPSLQMCFRDADTGLPMRSGYINFFVDNDRITPKTVYKLSGSAPNYSFTAIGSTIILTGIGTFSDNDGNDIIPYYLPYESDSSSVVELYFAQVFNEDNVPQFTREAWPPGISASDNDGTEIINFVPNGQFALHTNIPATDTTSVGEITEDVTNIAYGGCTFERSSDTMSDDFITFERFGSYTTNPTSSPRYSVRAICTDAGVGADYKDLRIKWADVNKFASDTQEYSLSVTAKTNSGSGIPLLFLYIKNYGTGGSVTPQEELEIGVASLTATYQIFNSTFVFGSNVGATIGTNDDDFTQIAIRYPVDEIFDISLSDIVLTIGDVDISVFPVTPNAEFIYQSLAGGESIPDYNSLDLYLPIVLGPTGYQTDKSVIGNVVYESEPEVYTNSLSTTTNRLLPDGNSYITTSYSPLGIPFSRLFNKYWSSTFNLPVYGTGSNYVTAINVSPSLGALNTELLITTNILGSVSNTVDGVTGTGFTIATTHAGNDYGTISYIVPTGGFGTGQFYIQNTTVGVVPPPNLGSASGNMTFALGTVGTGKTSGVVQLGNALVAEIVGFQPPTNGAAGMTAGQYIVFSTPSTTYYIWWKIGGSGSDPAPGGGMVGIEVDLDSADTQTSVGEKIRQALNGWQQTTLQVVAAAAITGGAYFRTFSTTKSYSVWYKVAGVGSAPGVSDEEIEVDLAGTETIQQVITATVIAMNGFQFASPNYQGLILRNVNNGGMGDPDAIYRFSLTPLVSGDQIGTFQNNQNQSHTHYENSFNEYQGSSSTEGFIQNGSGAIVIAGYPEGGRQSNPNNASTNMAIIY